MRSGLLLGKLQLEEQFVDFKKTESRVHQGVLLHLQTRPCVTAFH